MTTLPRLVRRTAATGTATLLAAVFATTASAAPYPGFPSIPPTKPDSAHSADCTLRRVDHQLVRCDYLTGAGVSAPSWVPSHF